MHTVGHLQAIHLQRDALLAEAQEATNADHEALNALGVLAKNEIADASDLARLIGRVHCLANQTFRKNCAVVLHDDLTRDGHLGAFSRCRRYRRQASLMRRRALRHGTSHTERERQCSHTHYGVVLHREPPATDMDHSVAHASLEERLERRKGCHVSEGTFSVIARGMIKHASSRSGLS